MPFVNVSCANMHREAKFQSEVVSQAILWESVVVHKEENGFLNIRTEDHYEGWLHHTQISEPEMEMPKETLMITRPEAALYENASAHALQIRDAVSGCSIPVFERRDQWYRTILPDGRRAFIEQEAVDVLPPLSRKNLLEYALNYSGRPYHWGGKTAKGFDCSGFTQFIHKMFGIQIRRDAWMQFEDANVVSNDFNEGRPGDLMFFAEKKDKITHVGFCLGEGRLLHVRGMVRINSLKEDDALFDPLLYNDFTEVRTFLA